MASRVRAWLITIQRPREEHYNELKTGSYVYATWKTSELGLQAIVYYKNGRVRPGKVWDGAEVEAIPHLSEIIGDCTEEDGWISIGTRPEKGTRRQAAKKREELRENFAKLDWSEQACIEDLKEYIVQLSKYQATKRKYEHLHKKAELTVMRMESTILGSFSSGVPELSRHTELEHLKEIAKGTKYWPSD